MNKWLLEILGLMDRVIAGNLSVDTFCSTYENLWNFERDTADLAPEEQSALSDLFQVVAWYTPIEEDRKAYPGFKSEGEVIDKVRKVRACIHRTRRGSE